MNRVKGRLLVDEERKTMWINCGTCKDDTLDGQTSIKADLAPKCFLNLD